jgi:hypothetical protein
MGSSKNMKHIKPFNEAKDNWFNIKVSDVLDFANNSHLAYLLDEGYTIDVRRQSGGTHNDNDLLDSGSYIRIINLEGMTKSIPKPWSEMKDYIIPFLKRFLNEFGLSNEVKIEMGLKCISTDNLSLLKAPIAIKAFTPDDIYDNKVKLGKGDCVAEVYWIKIKNK